jgi:hypothetical protein
MRRIVRGIGRVLKGERSEENIAAPPESGNRTGEIRVEEKSQE